MGVVRARLRQLTAAVQLGPDFGRDAVHAMAGSIMVTPVHSLMHLN